MAAGGLRERKKEKTRQALIRSALRQFGRRGFEGVTVEEIAGACDVSPRTFFRYFGSKEDVLFADADVQRAHLMDVLASLPPELPPLRALQAAVLEVAGDYEDQRDALLLRHRIVAATPSLHGRVADRHHCWESEVIAELRRSGRGAGMSELTLRLSVAAATTALGVATDVWIEGKGEGDLRALLSEALDRLRAGLER
ncbi:MAG: TetR family transcriptional regulator [Actinomycetota bacterium]|nr:TetR family transcriptional regulator [Actinomycetota bacterium]